LSLASAAATILLASSAEARWTPPSTLARVPPLARCECFSGSALATSPRRGSTVAWIDPNTDDVIARRILRNGRFGRARILGNGDYSIQPAISMTRSGTTVALWYDDEGVLVARRMTRGGRLGRLHQIAPPSTTDAGVGVDARGVATIVWDRVVNEPVAGNWYRILSSTVQARRLTVKGELGPVVDLYPGKGLSTGPRVAVAPPGQATVLWHEGPEGGCVNTGPHSFCDIALRAAMIGRDGTVGPVRDFGTGSYDFTDFVTCSAQPRCRRTVSYDEEDLAADVHGNAIVATGVTLRRFGLDGALGPVHVLDDTPPIYAVYPRVGIDRRGNTTVVLGGQVRRVYANFTLGPVWDGFADRCGSGNVDVAVDPPGDATGAWLCSHKIQTRRIARDGKLGPTRTIATTSAGIQLSGLDLVADARGVVTAAWYQARRTPAGEAPSVRTIKVARFVP
jgi:YD repeat-containing protein